MSKKFTPNSRARWRARPDSVSVVGPHTWPIPPPPHPTRDTRKPVRPKTVYSMVADSSVLWAPSGRGGEQTRLLFGHHSVPEGPDAANLDLHHVPRPHVRGGALRPQPDDVPRVERAVPADLGNMAGRIEEHVPGVELYQYLTIKPDRGLQVVGGEIRGDPAAHGLEGVGV